MPASKSTELPPGGRHLCQLFRLSAEEERLLGLLLQQEGPLTLGQAAGELGVGAADLALLLLPDGPLRGHALVEVEERAEFGLPLPGDRLYPARGLLQAIDVVPGAADDQLLSRLIEGQAPGVEYLPALPAGTAWAQDLLLERPPPAIAELVKGHLVAQEPRLLWLSGCGAEACRALGKALRARLQRPVLFIDCQAYAGWPPALLHAVLRRLRRDADLRGAVVLAHEVQELKGGWRALCGPRPPGQTAPVVLGSSGALPPPGPVLCPPGRREETALSVHSAALRPAEGPAPAAAPVPEPPPSEEVSASRDDARRQAAIDAARAMGKPIPAEVAKPPPRPVPAAVARAPIAAPPSADEKAPAPPPAPAPAPADEKVPGPPLAPADERLPVPPPADENASGPPPAPADESAPVPPPPAPPPDDGPMPDPLPLAADAPLDEIARVARQTPNARQRIELLRALAGKRSSAVILAFRQNLGSAHPGVREAAEAGMASIFGPEWNRSRAIAPPVQPPRSDDSGRGPGGAF